MVSGKYSALSGAISREQAMANISANLANITTSGFKKDKISFQSILRGVNQNQQARGINYARIRAIETDFSQGNIQVTDRPLDVAIEGQGFLKVMADNQVFYTRAGSLTLDENGMLKTQNGLSVLDEANAPIQVDTAESRDIAISDDGSIAVNNVFTGARIGLFTVPEADKLVKTGDQLYRLEGRVPDQPAEGSRLVQGSLEFSNVNMIEEMVAMIATQRAFEAHHKAIESYSKLSAKYDELGSLS